MECSKTILTGKFIAIQSYHKKQVQPQIKKPNLTWEATRERRAKPKISRRKEITKIRAEINEIETKKERKKRSKKPKLVL